MVSSSRLNGACKAGAGDHHCRLLPCEWRTEEGGLPRAESGADVQRAALTGDYVAKESKRGEGSLPWLPLARQVLVSALHETSMLLLSLGSERYT